MPKKSPDPVPGAVADTLPPPSSYESALGELERLTERMESGQLPLSDLLASYQRGAQLLTYCRTQLSALDDQVKLFDGTPINPTDAQS
jgi:exodeoxyribonuclease VII small subunit